MTVQLLNQTVDIWVAQYIAIFCLLTIVIWGVGSYLLFEKWQAHIRDASVYLLTIGVLATILALCPNKTDVTLWAPITWFCFAMLMVIELLWVAYLAEGIIRLVQSVPSRVNQLANDVTTYRDGYPRR